MHLKTHLNYQKGLFNLNYMEYCQKYSNISIHYFEVLKRQGDLLKEWRMKLSGSLNAHGVVGQEFDKVLVLIGSTI